VFKPQLTRAIQWEVAGSCLRVIALTCGTGTGSWHCYSPGPILKPHARRAFGPVTPVFPNTVTCKISHWQTSTKRANGL